jgi:hypothetical protein
MGPWTWWGDARYRLRYLHERRKVTPPPQRTAAQDVRCQLVGCFVYRERACVHVVLYQKEMVLLNLVLIELCEWIVGVFLSFNGVLAKGSCYEIT